MIGFDEQRLLGAAAQHLAVVEPLEPAFMPAFRALLTGLREEAGLSQVGSWRAGARVMTALGQRVALAEFEHDTPELASIKIERPIFITGFPRSGSNLLHNLLVRVPGLWGPRLWELHRPVPPPRIDERWIDRQIHAAEELLDQLDESAPDFRRIHPLSATSPDSCSWLFRNNFSSLVHAFMWHMPSYVEFMLHTDMAPAYRDHRRFVRALSHRHRHDDLAGPRIVLEDSWHLWHLDALLGVYPDACVIQVHAERDQILQNLARSCWTLRHVDAKRPRSVAQVRDEWAAVLDAGMASAERARERGGRFIDIDHAQLVADPLGVVRSLAPRLQLSLQDGALQAASRLLLDQSALGCVMGRRPSDTRPRSHAAI
jgi:LPS sulfotransferase NodH